MFFFLLLFLDAVRKLHNATDIRQVFYCKIFKWLRRVFKYWWKFLKTLTKKHALILLREAGGFYDLHILKAIVTRLESFCLQSHFSSEFKSAKTRIILFLKYSNFLHNCVYPNGEIAMWNSLKNTSSKRRFEWVSHRFLTIYKEIRLDMQE